MRIGRLIILALLFVGFMALMTYILQVCWNEAIVPAINGLHPISFWQSLGLNVGVGILVPLVTMPCNTGASIRKFLG